MYALGFAAILLAGVSLGLIGGGGSILTVPILVYLFEIEPAQATGYSLLIVGLTAAAGAYRNHMNDTLSLKTGFAFAAPGTIGVYVSRAYVLPAIPDVVLQFPSFTVTKNSLLMSAFALLMIMAAAAMLRPSKVDSASETAAFRQRPATVLIIGFMVGGMTGLLGAGGGFLIIPALANVLRLPMKTAVGTSLLVIAINSFWGLSTDLLNGHEMKWSLLIPASLVSIAGMHLGALSAKKLSERALKRAFAYLVLLMGLGIFFDQIY